jgi:SAM-dependent methyltransferase
MIWPKQRIILSAEEEKIGEDWQAFWLTRAQRQFSGIQRFNHNYVLGSAGPLCGPVLEIGAGDGEHVRLEEQAGTRLSQYHVLEMREDLASIIRTQFPVVDVRTADCQKILPFESRSIRRIVAIHVLEHLDNLPAFLLEAVRVLDTSGCLVAVIPCEGGALYAAGRNMTTKRLFQKRYGLSYERFIRAEHVNTAREVITEAKRHFDIESSEWWPARVPSVHLNVCIGLRMVPKRNGAGGSAFS